MKIKHVVVLPLLAGGLAMVSGCVVRPDGSVAFQPVVIAPAPVVVDSGPPPVVGVDVAVVPDNYVWDGYENVGYIGDQPYYLGAGNVWIVCDSVRIGRFNGWVGVHPDWRDHLTVNANYRYDAHGRFYPQRSAAARNEQLDRQQQRIDALHQKRDDIHDQQVQNQQQRIDALHQKRDQDAAQQKAKQQQRIDALHQKRDQDQNHQ